MIQINSNKQIVHIQLNFKCYFISMLISLSTVGEVVLLCWVESPAWGQPSPLLANTNTQLK